MSPSRRVPQQQELAVTGMTALAVIASNTSRSGAAGVIKEDFDGVEKQMLDTAFFF
jgi:hypothetical protein